MQTLKWLTVPLISAWVLTGSPLAAQTGPMVGTVKTEEAWFLYRPGAEEKTLRLSVLDGATVVATDESTSDRGTLLVGNVLNLVDLENAYVVSPIGSADLGNTFTISIWT